MDISIKPLEWTQSAPPGHEHEPFVYWAAGLGGHYRAERDGLLWMAHDEFVWEQHPSQKAAKAAAQADYETRIRSALAASPAPVTEAMLDRLSDIAAGHLEIDYDGDDPFIRSDSIEEAIREVLTTALGTATATKKGPPFHFDRYVNGVLMAEGVQIDRASDFAEAAKRAASLAAPGANGETPVLVASLGTATARIPYGWKLVPVEPTEAMCEAGMSPFLAAHDPMYNKNEPCGPIYKAMLAASPSPDPEVE